MRRRILLRLAAVVLALTICLASVTFYSVVEADPIVGVQPTGSGTEDDPYLISNALELVWVRDQSNQSNSFTPASTKFVLTNDIDMSSVCGSAIGSWMPIGFTNWFQYKFDGCGHTISNLYIEKFAENNCGLFGKANGGAVIQNLILDSSCSISGKNTVYYVGGLVGYIGGSGTVEILNCGSSAAVSGGNHVGGLIGGVNGNMMNQNQVSLTMNSCYVKGNVSGISGVAALCGSCTYAKATVANCYFLSGCATGEFGSVTTGFAGNANSNGVVESKTAEQFQNGEVAYLLNEHSSGTRWGQKIGSSDAPSVNGAIVRYDSEKGYHNPGCIYGANLRLGDDLAMLYYALLDESCENAKIRFTWQEDEYLIPHEADKVGTYFVYKFSGISPQCMGDNLKAELVLEDGDTIVLDHIDEFSVLQYCIRELKANRSAEENTLLVDLLEYGAASQMYTDYHADRLVTNDAGYLSAKANAEAIGSTDLPAAASRTLTGNASANGTKMKSINLFFDSRNRFVLRFAIGEGDSVSVRCQIGSKAPVTYNTYTEESPGVFRLMTDSFSVLSYDDDVVIELLVNGEPTQVLTYSVNKCCYALTKEGSTADEHTRALAIATYRYGISAERYAA